jgi:hypothetical protein
MKKNTAENLILTMGIEATPIEKHFLMSKTQHTYNFGGLNRGSYHVVEGGGIIKSSR